MSISTNYPQPTPDGFYYTAALLTIDTATSEPGLSVWDLVAINQIVTDYGRTRRGAAMVREYLDNRDNA